jgi:hypothetical protein
MEVSGIFAPWPLYLRERTAVPIEGTVFRRSLLYRSVLLSIQITRSNAHQYKKLHYDIHCRTKCGHFTVPKDVALNHHINLIKSTYSKTKNSASGQKAYFCASYSCDYYYI